MHRCLYVDEIVLMIATNLNLPGNRRTLSRMALTCKTFHGPADEVLWEELPGLRPLLSLLPEDAYRIPKKRVCCNGNGEDEMPGGMHYNNSSSRCADIALDDRTHP